MTTAQRFSSHIDILYEVIDRQVVLDTEYPNIYNQVVKHYEEKGVDFYGDVDEDYDILLTKLEQDLFYYEPSESSSCTIPLSVCLCWGTR